MNTETIEMVETNKLVASLLGCDPEDITSVWMDDEIELRAMLVDEFKTFCKSYNDDLPIKKADLPNKKHDWYTLDLHEFRNTKIVFSAPHLDTIFFDKQYEQKLVESVDVEKTNDRWLVGKANFYIRMANDDVLDNKIATKSLGSELDKDVNIMNTISGKFENGVSYTIMVTRTGVNIIQIDDQMGDIGHFVLENASII